MNDYKVWASFKVDNSYDSKINTEEVIEMVISAENHSFAIAIFSKWVRRNSKDVYPNITKEGFKFIRL